MCHIHVLGVYYKISQWNNIKEFSTYSYYMMPSNVKTYPIPDTDNKNMSFALRKLLRKRLINKLFTEFIAKHEKHLRVES